MTKKKGPPRRMAYIQFPQEMLSRQAIERIAAEGYDDISLGLIPDEGHMGNIVGQGFTLRQGRQLHDWAVELGMAVTVFTGYMKYEEPLIAKEPQRAMVTYGGSGQRHDSDGIRSNWLCPFQPRNLERYLSNMLLPAMEWKGLRELHLNDEAFLGFDGGEIGCYCDYCSDTYRSITGMCPPTQADWKSESWQKWINYRLHAWTEIHARLRERLRKIRTDVLIGIQHSPIAPLFAWNPWKTAIDLGSDAKAMDLLATDPYHYLHLDVATLRPHRRLLTEGVRGLAGACLGNRAMTIYPQGFMPPGTSVPMGRQDGLLAGVVPYAMGADAVSPYTYEMMKIIPGYDEGWGDARKLMPLFNRLTPAPFVTVIAPVQTEIHAHPDQNWGSTYMTGVMDVMYRVGLPWRWFWDSRIEDAADELKGPLIVPEAACLTARQLQAIRKVESRGEGVLWIGTMADGNWDLQFTPTAGPDVNEYEMTPTAAGHPLFTGLPGPVMLQSCADGPAGNRDTTIAFINGKAALTMGERSAWLAGLPKFTCVSRHVHGVVGRETGGIELLRRLLLRIASSEPACWFEPFPFKNDYARIRPWDLRGVHNAELFPMIGPGVIVAIVFPYTPVGFETSIRFSSAHGTIRRVTEVWSGEDWSTRMQGSRLPIEFPGDCELMVIKAELTSND